MHPELARARHQGADAEIAILNNTPDLAHTQQGRPARRGGPGNPPGAPPPRDPPYRLAPAPISYSLGGSAPISHFTK